MKERTILFNSEMVRAILDGRKTQTRRIIKGTDDLGSKNFGHCLISDPDFLWMNIGGKACKFPFGKIGDRLWLRETFQALWKSQENRGDWETGENYDLFYKATDQAQEYYDESKEHLSNEGVTSAWKPSIHMPRWASIINLEITNVSVERIQDGGDREFWGETTWEENPWCWKIEFKRVT